jgi:hypothetical protein
LKVLNLTLPCKTIYGKKLLILILFFISVLISSISFAAIPPSERTALIALYTSTGGDNWTHKTGWKVGEDFAPSGTEGTWYGITVSSNSVTSISLAENNLGGSIPAELRYLPNLLNLYLNVNNLSGSIPSEVGYLTKLKKLYLNSNKLSGSIPITIASITNLEELQLGSNALTGSIPAEICNLKSLKYLYLYLNELSGVIPEAINGLTNLQDLSLSGNKLISPIPETLWNMLSLKALQLGENLFTGKIPNGIGNLSNLEYLYLYENQFSGNIPTEIGNLTKIKALSLNGNKLDGAIPLSFSNLTFLMRHFLSLDYNALYTDSNDLRTFINNYNSNWEVSQTIVPENVTTGTVTETTVQVQWSPVTYTDPGGYRVFYSTSHGGPYTYFGLISDKTTTQLNTTRLDLNTIYYFTVQTFTNPHANNQNTVTSNYSQEAVYYPPLTDTDSDGIPDGVEDKNRNGVVDSGETDPTKADTDGDGISDGVEDANHNGRVDIRETNPLNSDTDNDGMPDGWEVQYDFNPLVNDANEDDDGDGYSNLKEYKRKTIPNDYNSQPSKDMPWLPLLLGD